MLLWTFLRTCFLWLPSQLYGLCMIVFVVFGFLFLLKVLRTIWDAIPWL